MYNAKEHHENKLLLERAVELFKGLTPQQIESIENLECGEEKPLDDGFCLYRYDDGESIMINHQDTWTEVLQLFIEEDNSISYEIILFTLQDPEVYLKDGFYGVRDNHHYDIEPKYTVGKRAILRWVDKQLKSKVRYNQEITMLKKRLDKQALEIDVINAPKIIKKYQPQHYVFIALLKRLYELGETREELEKLFIDSVNFEQRAYKRYRILFNQMFEEKIQSNENVQH